ncbi:Microtubule-associated protein, microtubule dynamics during spindle orientation [Mortierella polycephala]|uniref:Microtubule-associated protein, microtubule dynamics during spindle orientation n=1 Tax=Mortierella polycephala TaxID=41804 RepID=A0A9P6QAB4_9FUNG|nr:Microtubule-associated protein, microtubule dynamics during spindle orientation [Mortierella polycephala]
MDEYGSNAPQENFNSIPVQERLEHKNWKARVSAYEELAKLFRTSVEDSDFRRFEGSLKKIALDSNAVAQESGLTTLIQFVENAPDPNRTKSVVVPAVVEKCLSSTRTGTKNKALELILLYVEVDTPDPVIEDVLPGLGAKLPKLVATTTNALAAIVRTFGIKNINVKPLVKKLPPLFGHSDKNVRAEASALTIELYRWLKKAIMPSLEDLKPVQQKELGEAFDKLPDERPTPLKYLRSQQAEMAAAAAAAEAADEDGEAAEEEEEDMVVVDELDLIDPVDVNAKMESNFYELLASKKWQERKEALDGLLVHCKSPKIVDSNYSELVGALGKRMTDTNINIVIVAANCLEGLARGLRDNFQKYKPSVAGLVMDRLKERKVTVVEALSGALNAIYSTAPYSGLLEDSAANVAHKNPQIRAEVIKLQIQLLKEIKIAPSRVEIKTACEMLVKAFEDADANVREATAEALGTLMKCCGEKPLLAYLEKLDAVKMGKVKEYSEKAVVKAKAAPVAAPPKAAPKAAPKVLTSSKPAAKKPAPSKASDPPKKPLGKAPVLSSAKKPVAKASAATSSTAAKKTAPAGGGSKKDEEPLRYKYSSETAEDLAAEFLPPDLIAEFGDSSWKVRLEAMEKLHDLVDSNTDFEAELITRVLAKKPGWKESNFQVTTKLYGILQLQAQKLPTFSKACAALTIPAMIDKMGDIKLKKAAGDCLTVYAETLSLQFVLSQSYEPLKKLKAPKGLADSLLWIKQQLEDFGIAGLQVRELIDFLKVALGSANAAVRTNAVTVLGILRRFIGPGIRSFVEDCNSALLATIDAEFAKVADMEPPQVSKGMAEASADDAGASAGAAAVEELFPKVDISNQLTSALLEECGDANWKVRKEGLEKITAIIEANKRIQPNLGGLPAALKLRLADSNKNLQIQTMGICACLANAMGKPFERYARILCAEVASCLTDQKDNVRGASIAALEAFATQSGLDSLVSSLATSLVTNSPTLRKDLLTWLTTFCNGAKERGATLPDLSPFATPVLQCLQDRSVEVRKASQAFLPILMANVGYDAVVAKCSGLKSAAKSAIMPLLEAAKPAPPPRPPSAAGAAKAPAERGALNTLPSLSRAGAKPGARPGASSIPGLPSKTAPRGATSALPTAPGPSREEQSSPIPALPAYSSLPGPGQSNIAARSRLTLKKPGQTIPSTMDPGIPGAQQRASRPHDMQTDYDEFSVPPPGGSRMSANMNMHQRPYDSMEGISTQPLNGSRPPMSNNNMSGMGGGNLGMNNGLSQPPPATVVPPSAQIKRLSVSGGDRRGEAVMDYIVTQITSDDPLQSIDALKQLEKALHGPVDVIIPHINELVNAHTLQIRLAYTGLEQRNNSTTRVCKHLVNSVVSIFSNKQLASKVQSDPLYNLLHELASRLLDKNLDRVESGQMLAKALNVTMVRVLENSNRNATFSALLLILVRCAQQLRNLEDSAHQAKFGDLIMKCIWKLTKTIKESVAAGTLKANELLADMNDFLVSISPPEWKRRAQEGVPLGDLPLRTVKTVLVELSSGMGDEIFNHLDLIHDPTKSAIHQYLVHMTGSKKRPIAQVHNPAIQPMPGNTGHGRMSVIGAMTSQNLSVHNLTQHQQHQQQQQPQSLGHSGLQLPHSPQLQQSPLFQHQSISPRLSQQAAFGAQNQSPQGLTSGFGMQQQHQYGDMGGAGVGPNRMSMAMGRSQSPGQSADVNESKAIDDMSGLSETEMNGRLTQIFTKIGTREETKQGISDLYQFQKMYPNMESKVNAQLAKTGTFFQSYIRRGLANLEADANATAANGGSALNSSGSGGINGIGSPKFRDRETGDAAARKRESVMSIVNSESGISATGGGSADPSESYKDRLARLQQMFGYKSESKTPSPVQDAHETNARLGDGGRNSPGLTMRQQQEMDYQQHQLQQQHILAQHNRSRPSSIYQSSLSTSAASPTASQFGSSVSGMHSPYQTHFNHQENNSNVHHMGGMTPATSAPSLQSLQESMAAKERAQTVALMKERLARMKTQTLTSSQLALQQFHQQQTTGTEHGHGQGNHASGSGGGQYF